MSKSKNIRNRTLKQRFEERIMPEPMTGCWLWMGATNDNGYGVLSVNNHLERAHRIAYELYVGPIPEHLDVCHHCDTNPCCNPFHLFAGTESENMQDSIKKGRFNRAHGITHYCAKLTEDRVIQIRQDKRSHRIIAKDHSISAHTVHAIKSGKVWKHIP